MISYLNLEYRGLNGQAEFLNSVSLVWFQLLSSQVMGISYLSYICEMASLVGHRQPGDVARHTKKRSEKQA